uniref:Putative secreted protein n=1 Tax=Ixodes ricinus TaxID=34613 RepID=A0A6B0UT65_IXORI
MAVLAVFFFQVLRTRCDMCHNKRKGKVLSTIHRCLYFVSQDAAVALIMRRHSCRHFSFCKAGFGTPGIGEEMGCYVQLVFPRVRCLPTQGTCTGFFTSCLLIEQKAKIGHNSCPIFFFCARSRKIKSKVHECCIRFRFH